MTRRKDGRYQEVMVQNGKRRYFYGKTKAEVLRKIKDFEEQQERGATLAELLDSWYESHAQSVRYKTRESYVAPINQIKEHFADAYVREISPVHISAFIKHIEKQGYAKRTIQLRLDVLRMAFDYAIAELGMISSNPCAAISLSKNLPVGKRSLPSSEDIAAIVAHAQDDRFSLLPFLLCYSGMRLGEALALTDEDFTDEFITVNKHVSWQPNQPIVEPWTKTEKGIRNIPLVDVLKNALPKWHGYLFSDDGKKPYSKSAFTKRWRRYAQRTNITTDRHSLRHEFSTLLYDAKVDTKEAAEIMGHDEKVMRDIYTHIRENRRKKTFHQLNDYVNRMSNSPETIDNA